MLPLIFISKLSSKPSLMVGNYLFVQQDQMPLFDQNRYPLPYVVCASSKYILLTQFTSEVVKEVVRLLSLQQLTTSALWICWAFTFNFQSNAAQNVCLRPRYWEMYPSTLYVIRAVPQGSLGFPHLNYYNGEMSGILWHYCRNYGPTRRVISQSYRPVTILLT